MSAVIGSEPFAWAVGVTLGHEGVFSNHSWDPGGATKYGITEAVARSYGVDVRTLTVEQAQGIYFEEYWRPIGLDAVAGDSWRVAAEIFDTAVNCGLGRASKIAQQAASEIFGESVAVDGYIGPLTRAALGRIVRKGYEDHLVHALNGYQFEFYLGLLRRGHPAARHSIRGWMMRLSTPVPPPRDGRARAGDPHTRVAS